MKTNTETTVPEWRAELPNKAWQLEALAKIYRGAGLDPYLAWQAAMADMESLSESNRLSE